MAADWKIGFLETFGHPRYFYVDVDNRRVGISLTDPATHADGAVFGVALDERLKAEDLYKFMKGTPIISSLTGTPISVVEYLDFVPEFGILVDELLSACRPHLTAAEALQARLGPGWKTTEERYKIQMNLISDLIKGMGLDVDNEYVIIDPENARSVICDFLMERINEDGIMVDVDKRNQVTLDLCGVILTVSR